MNNPNALIMVRPEKFGFNVETAISNKFQQISDEQNIQELAQNEFDAMVNQLIREAIEVVVFNDTPEPVKPDCIFPNNWISMSPNGEVVLYPMEAKNRRLERREDVVAWMGLRREISIIDLTEYEKHGDYLEGTGSIIFDHNNRIAYCAESSRSNVVLFEKLCSDMNYTPISFVAKDLNGYPIYHTNVMLSIGDQVAVICAESIENPIERNMVLNAIQQTKKEIIEIDFQQMVHFGANCLEVNDISGQSKLIMSKTAFKSLKTDQIQRIQLHSKIIAVEIPTIESVGGGSARCMLLGVWV